MIINVCASSVTREPTYYVSNYYYTVEDECTSSSKDDETASESDSQTSDEVKKPNALKCTEKETVQSKKDFKKTKIFEKIRQMIVKRK